MCEKNLHRGVFTREIHRKCAISRGTYGTVIEMKIPIWFWKCGAAHFIFMCNFLVLFKCLDGLVAKVLTDEAHI